MIGSMMKMIPKKKMIGIASSMTGVITDMSSNPMTKGNPVTIIARKVMNKETRKREPQVLFCYKKPEGGMVQYQAWNKDGVNDLMDAKGKMMVNMLAPAIMKLISRYEKEKNNGYPMEFHIRNKEIDEEITASIELVKLMPVENEDGSTGVRREVDSEMKFLELINHI